MSQLNSLSNAVSSLTSTQPLSSQFPTANSTSSIPIAVSGTMDTNMGFGGGLCARLCDVDADWPLRNEPVPAGKF